MGSPDLKNQKNISNDSNSFQADAPKPSQQDPLLAQDSRGAAKMKNVVDNLAKISVAEDPLTSAKTAEAVAYNQRSPRKNYNWEAIAAKLGAPSTANDERMAKTLASKQDALKNPNVIPDGKLGILTIRALDLQNETTDYVRKQKEDPQKDNAKKVEKTSNNTNPVNEIKQADEDADLQADPIKAATHRKENTTLHSKTMNDMASIESSDTIGSIKAWYATREYSLDTLKAIQRAVGVKDDGCFGENTINAIITWQSKRTFKTEKKGRFDQECADAAGITLTFNTDFKYNTAGEFQVPEVERFNNPSDKLFSGHNGESKKKNILKQLFGYIPNLKDPDAAKKTDKKQKTVQEKEVEKQMISVSVPVHDLNGNIDAIFIKIHYKLASNVKAIFNEIFMDYPSFRINPKECWGYNYRPTRCNGENGESLSNHSFGIAFDINSGVNKYRKNGKPMASGDTDTEMRTLGHQVVQICAKHGFGWGGQYGDDMHFSIFNGA